MTQSPLPLPEAAFDSWQSLTREFERALRILRLHGGARPEHWARYENTLRHIRRILHPARIDQLTLAREKSRQMRDDPGGNIVSDWIRVAEGYDDLGFATPAALARARADLLAQVDWDTVPAEREFENKISAPADMQPQFDAIFEAATKIAKADNVDDIRTAFAARADDYTIMQNEAFNTLMVETLHADENLQTQISSPGTQQSIRKTFVAMRPQGRKDFAKAVVANDVRIFRERWEYLPRDASDTTLRSLWVGAESLVPVTETPQGTDDDLAPYQVDVVVTAWPSGNAITTFSYDASTKASRAAALAAERLPMDRFMNATIQLTDITDKGRLVWLHKLPLIGSLAFIITMALHPRMTYRIFCGMGQQGVKSAMILRHTGRAVFWAVLLSAFSAMGITKLMFQTWLAGLASWSDIAFLVGFTMGVAVLGQAIPTAFGLIVGSFDRRNGRGWSSNLPDTGHENFITRNKKNSARG